MRQYLLYFTLALIPTVLSSSPITPKSYYFIEGTWYDDYTNTQLEIRNHRRGIKVRRNGRKWKTFNDMGRGVFDDCKGSAIVMLRSGEIKYRRKRKRPIYMSRYNSYGRGDYNRGGYGRDRYDRDDYYGQGRSRRDRDRSRGNNGYRDKYCGQWYCNDRGINLTIETYGSEGIRARIGNDDWSYYDDYRNNRFFNNRGNGYYFDNDVLIWSSRNGRRKLRFRKG